MDRFSKFNPRVCFLFFLLQMILSLVIFNPFYLAISLVGAVSYNIKLKGRTALKSFFAFLLPLIVFVAVFNMIFARYGQTVLFNVFDIDFTLEALFYGFNQGMMLACVITWLSCYGVVMTSDKFLLIFSRLAPNTSLVFSMALSFLPRLQKNAREISDASMPINTDKSTLKKSLDNFSALVTMTLEESVEVANSMKARGFSNGRRPYSKYMFSPRDGAVISGELFLFAVCLYFRLTGKTLFIFEPVIIADKLSPLSLISFGAISFLPLIIDFWEDLRWLYLKRKI